jgi:hypothetical protein
MMTPSSITLEPFQDDFGNIVLPYKLDYNSYMSRYYFYKESV